MEMTSRQQFASGVRRDSLKERLRSGPRRLLRRCLWIDLLVPLVLWSALVQGQPSHDRGVQLELKRPAATNASARCMHRVPYDCHQKKRLFCGDAGMEKYRQVLAVRKEREAELFR